MKKTQAEVKMELENSQAEKLRKSLMSRINQVEARIIRLRDKVDKLDNASNEYEKFNEAQKRNTKELYEMIKSFNYKHR